MEECEVGQEECYQLFSIGLRCYFELSGYYSSH